MSHSTLIRFGIFGVLLAVLGLRSAAVLSDPTYTAGSPPTVAQIPLYMRDAVPPLNMLVMGKDHKIYYEAYNDASDLNGDGILDVGYKPALTYYGYFNSNVCYDWNSDRFVPSVVATNKQCSGRWSGDFLNYLTTSRMDALRRVLYGGWRQVDNPNLTILQGAFFPQDAHSWGKEYQSVARDGYDIRNYAPLPLPAADRYHLFAVTTTRGNADAFIPGYQAPLFRVMENSPYRIWNWLSIEGPVAGLRCFNASSQRVTCTSGGAAQPFPGHPASEADFDKLESNYAIAANRFGTDAPATINCDTGCNPFTGQQDNFLTVVDGQFQVAATSSGRFQFAVDGDDAVDFLLLNGATRLAQVGWYGGHGWCNCGTYATGEVTLAPGNTYRIRFRHEEQGGDERFYLRYRERNILNGQWGAWTIVPQRSLATSGLLNLSRSTYNLTPPTASVTRTDYLVRVVTCPDNAALRDETCKTYPNGFHKPTGILHDYGENQRMYFGLMTGSQRNNLEGGVLRRNVSNFADEVNANTGQFRTNVDGIARTIDKLRMIGNGYTNGADDNTNGDSNMSWSRGGNCPSIGGRPIDNGECRMWGNPIAEMMYESMRYFAGAGSATPRFETGGASQGATEDDTMRLTTEEWKNPYGSGSSGLNYPSCARPYQTILSDINPSYDGDLPGSAFAGAITTTGTTPTAISGFNAASEGAAIWSSEFGGSRNVFIGESGAVSDGNPTVKAASSFGNIRGLAPEEPSKLGTYYSASVARFGRNNDINAAAGAQTLSTYSIALASPLPRIQFPLGSQTVTMVPFAKTVSGTFGENTRKPTNTIVDFYVEEYANFPGMPVNTTINGGRPRAVFRINYEDVEQGNDHDMDAIVRYEVVANADNTATVSLASEFGAGSANQNMGYVISGTTQDGIYLEVRDRDSPTTQYNPSTNPNGWRFYALNTPPGRTPGYCEGMTTTECGLLPLNNTRTFSPGSSGNNVQLRDPLWYAAKYGAPDLANWDTRVPGEPDNYFLVTNPLNLRAQLSKAFDDIANRDIDVGNRSVSGARVQSASFTLEPSFARRRNGADWVGNLTAISVYADGTLGPAIWNASSQLSNLAPSDRNIMAMINPAGLTATDRATQFVANAAFGANETTRLDRIGISSAATIPSNYGGTYTSTQLINYLRGDRTNEANWASGTAPQTLRERGSVLGDIVNSEPVIFSPRSDFGYGQYDDPTGMFDGYEDTGSTGFLRDKRNRKTVAYVGANDGMLHAFDASTTNCPADAQGRVIACPTSTSGTELFGFIPHGVLRNMGMLALPDNNFAHRYYVDGQITIADARNSGGTWKSVLVGTTGGGALPSDPAQGRSIYALDITSISTRTGATSLTSDKVLWERNSTIDRDIGRIQGKPLLLPLENDRWGVVFGNGYGGDRSDPSLYILDAFTGATIRKITANDGNPASTSFLGGLICSVLDFVLGYDGCARTTDPYNGLGQITAIDRDGNGKADTIYGGDLQGNLWKFDLRDTTNSANWGVYNFPTVGRVPLFTAQTGSEKQPITGGLRISAGPGNGVMVFFGTGRYVFQGDNEVATNPQVQALYGVFDNGPISGTTGSSPAGARANLLAQRIESQTTSGGFRIRNISQNTARYFGTGAVRGWYLDLKLNTATVGDGERFIATPRIQSGRVFFTTYTPSPNATGCAPGGLNWQYALDLVSGAGALSNVSTVGGGPVCTNNDCGGVSITDEEGNETLPPITNTGLFSIRPTQIINPGGTCNPATGENCPSFEQCQVVIYPGAFVLPRPCGRQSWRQLR